jgi:hypothetical protein
MSYSEVPATSLFAIVAECLRHHGDHSGDRGGVSLRRLTWLLVDPLAEPDTRSASILIDKLDAGGFESTPDDFDSRAARLACTSFELMHGHDCDSGEFREIGLIPPQESARRSALPRCDHA